MKSVCPENSEIESIRKKLRGPDLRPPWLHDDMSYSDVCPTGED